MLKNCGSAGSPACDANSNRSTDDAPVVNRQLDDTTALPFDSVVDCDADDPRLLIAAREYLQDLESGHVTDRQQYHARYPALAELDDCLDAVELAHRLGQAAGGSPPPSNTAAIVTGSVHERLGDFQLVREIGRGGMGIVYEAQQLSLGRRVALKLLPFAAALDQRQLQRFRLEAQAAAQLHHPHIVPVYAVGCERDTHFYAMQLIDGLPISDLLAGSPAAQQVGPATRFQLPAAGAQRTAQIVAWIAQVADALDHAHQVGIIHRDIKPGNLLLDSHGKIWVADFGLAQTITGQGLTQTGDLVGTLRYMSPEQTAGKQAAIDQRTDVYALGATLFEWLAGRPLYIGQDRSQLLKQILQGTAPPLRSVDRSFAIDLDTIVAKSLAQEPADRYATAAQLADDLRRFLEHRPIAAKRPSIWEVSRKWGRRHPYVVGSVIGSLLLGVLGLGISVGLISNEKQRTVQALERERQRASEAELRLQLTQQAADEMIWLAENELSGNPFEEGLQQRLLQSALLYYQELIRAREQLPAAQTELRQTRDRVQSILADLAILRSDRNSSLLELPDVQADLNTDARQTEQIVALVQTQHNDRQWWLQQRERLTPADVHQQIVASARRSDAQIAEILTPQQRSRLRQIALQVQGARAFDDFTVIETLGLNPDQRVKIKQLIGFGRGPGMPPGRPPGGPLLSGPPNGGGPPGPRLSLPTSNESQVRMQPILALLTAEQRAQWQQLIGEPYTGQLYN